MDEVGTKIIEILKKHMKEPRDDISLVDRRSRISRSSRSILR